MACRRRGRARCSRSDTFLSGRRTQSGELISLGHDFARCDSCGLPLLGSTLETLREVIGLPDALGAHPCECGHPEMRELPYRVLHCPACGSEVLPIQSASDVEKARLGSV